MDDLTLRLMLENILVRQEEIANHFGIELTPTLGEKVLARNKREAEARRGQPVQDVLDDYGFSRTRKGD